MTISETKHFSCCLNSYRGAFLVGENAELNLPSIVCDNGSPFCRGSMPSNSSYATSIVGAFRQILHVCRTSYVTKIAKSIIVFDPVYMVYFVGWPFSSHNTPSYTMSGKRLITKPKTNISCGISRSNFTSRKLRIPRTLSITKILAVRKPRRITFSPKKLSCFRIIPNELTNLRRSRKGLLSHIAPRMRVGQDRRGSRPPVAGPLFLPESLFVRKLPFGMLGFFLCNREATIWSARALLKVKKI